MSKFYHCVANGVDKIRFVTFHRELFNIFVLCTTVPWLQQFWLTAVTRQIMVLQETEWCRVTDSENNGNAPESAQSLILSHFLFPRFPSIARQPITALSVWQHTYSHTQTNTHTHTHTKYIYFLGAWAGECIKHDFTLLSLSLSLLLCSDKTCNTNYENWRLKHKILIEYKPSLLPRQNNNRHIHTQTSWTPQDILLSLFVPADFLFHVTLPTYHFSL